MQNFKFTSENKKRTHSCLLQLSVNLLFLCFFYTGYTQICPPNIDFENGTFDGWTCYTGTTAAVGDQNIISLNPSGGPVYNRHTMYSSNTGEVDYYGGFPVTCPNGSGHSIKLGSTTAGGQAEGVSYEFTIPANQNSYSLIYHYAVVFQSPNHRVNEQPRMEIEITDVTDNSVISCASFTFVAVGSSLPGFLVSNRSDTTAVLYKDWSAVSVDLSGKAGKKIRLFFKTADCTFKRHFGYAYIDVNSECNGSFAGATFCPDDTVVNVIGPYGYQGYTWYDSSLTQVLGTVQTLTLVPPPVSGTTIAVKLNPYSGYGCPTTLFTQLRDSLKVAANAGADGLSCNRSQVLIGTLPKPGLQYQWTPVAGLSNPEISNPVATPGVTTTYIVATSNSGGGCRITDTVVVQASIIDDSLQLIGKATYCIDNGDSALLKVRPTSSIQWYKDDITINGASQPIYRVNLSGIYYAQLMDTAGCRIATRKQPVIIDQAKRGITYPVEYAVVNLPLLLKARQIGETALWNPGVSLNTPASFAPTFTGMSERLYTINITTNTECLTVDTQLVKIIAKVEIYVPTAFTPNGDSRNDYLRPLIKGIKEVNYFRVFNRWGQLLFERRNDEQPGWDGTFKGAGLQSQTVVWMFQGIGVDNNVYSQKGSSILIR
ncbi:MAG: T9SS type B sorting domain-containing protein [Ferruginibacter sp.]